MPYCDVWLVVASLRLVIEHETVNLSNEIQSICIERYSILASHGESSPKLSQHEAWLGALSQDNSRTVITEVSPLFCRYWYTGKEVAF